MCDRASVAVVITNYNGWNLTENCARRCLQYDAERIGTLLVYDDGSSSPPPEDMPRQARVFLAPENRGLTKSLNAAIRMTSEDVVIVFDSDAYPTTPFCEAAARMFSEDPGLGLVAFRTIGSRGQSTESYSPEPNFWSILLGQALSARFHRCIADRSGRLAVFTCAMAVRREAFEEIGGFDEKFDWLELDNDFSMRMNRSRWRVAVCEGPRIFHEGGGTAQLTRRRVLRYYKNRWYLLRKFNRIPAAPLIKHLVGLRLRIEYLAVLLLGRVLFRDPAVRQDKILGRRDLVKFWHEMESRGC